MAVHQIQAVITAFCVVLPSLSEPGDISGALNDWSARIKSGLARRFKEMERLTRKPVEYPEVTISAFTETSQEESSIVVPLQRIYMGRKPVIPSILAGTPCSTFDMQSFLDQLNAIFGMSYSLDNVFLASLLVECMTNEYDFGLAYGSLRRIWYIDDWSTVRDVLWRWSLRPRRVWDLYSNRVVPCWLESYILPTPISHAWVEEKDHTEVSTPINGYEWPVPIPKDADLNLIRIEMFNLRHEYVWLDVLCLRQEGGPREGLRVEEWKVDVPTIGAVYENRKVVCYLSGLGRPLTLKEGDLESDQSWFRRAWTLQEVGRERVIARDTPDGLLHAECKYRECATELLTRFHTKLRDIRDWRWLHEILAEMWTRVSTNPVDKIAGLAFLMWSQWIPAYFRECISRARMDSTHEFDLFMSSPEPGDGGPKWRPSWHQAMTKPLLPYWTSTSVDRDETGGEDSCNEKCIDGFMWGLAVVEAGDRHASNVCVVGRSLPGGRFEKVSVVEAVGQDLQHITKTRWLNSHVPHYIDTWFALDNYIWLAIFPGCHYYIVAFLRIIG
ncbi:hypothetical protein IW261DRAFT_1651898 [Armillaria novae-zelandiae]|uniref:Heterokaryon incompatibility domain-containing protein n=1 Tax=Armillaria novae-zelandiae TaxID=153914 RepID=A0AA39NYA0_9AGAR|nr:hypothetical protein IW261DRAFT_1651898 [Armillaria novae-zelandiae]